MIRADPTMSVDATKYLSNLLRHKTTIPHLQTNTGISMNGSFTRRRSGIVAQHRASGCGFIGCNEYGIAPLQGKFQN
jgi:hypothetical protein